MRTLASQSPPRWNVIAGISLCGLVALVFLRTVSYGFVNWDDPWYVINNPLIASWRPANLWDIATRSAVRNYAPVTMFCYLVEHTLWGTWAGGYHLVNVALHAVNAVLVYVLLKQLTGNRFLGWTTAALFAVHPVQIETVAWISSFKGVLSGTFILASLIFWLRPERTAREDGWGLLCHFLGLLAKALGITVPAIVFLYDVLVGKKKPAEAFSRQIIPLTLAALVLLLTMRAQTADLGGIRGHLGWSKLEIAAQDSVILWRYLGLLAWPADLCVLYDLPAAGFRTIAIALLAWGIVVAVAIAVRRKEPLVLLALASFGALLFPVLNFFPITTLMNDRYLYLPSIAVFALVAAALAKLAALGATRRDTFLKLHDPDAPSQQTVRAILARSAAWSIAVTLVLFSVAATCERLPVWRNDFALWQDAIQKSPGLAVVRIQWATALHNSKRDADALIVLEHALEETAPDAADRERIDTRIADWSGPGGRGNSTP